MKEECERFLRGTENSLVPVDLRISKVARLISDKGRGT